MKKRIIILAVLISFGSSSLFAKDFWGFDNKGASYFVDVTFLALGGGSLTWILIDPFETEEYNYYWYGFGGASALLGLIGLFYDLATPDSDYYTMEKNPILEHVALNVAPKRVFVGGIWRW